MIFGDYVKQITKIILRDIRGVLVMVTQTVIKILMVSSSGIFVNKKSTSRLVYLDHAKKIQEYLCSKHLNITFH